MPRYISKHYGFNESSSRQLPVCRSFDVACLPDTGASVVRAACDFSIDFCFAAKLGNELTTSEKNANNHLGKQPAAPAITYLLFGPLSLLVPVPRWAKRGAKRGA